MDDGIPPHSLMKKLGFNWLEVLVEHSPSCMPLMDLLRLRARIVRRETTCWWSRYWRNRICRAGICWHESPGDVRYFSSFTDSLIYSVMFLVLRHSANACCHPWFGCSSGAFGGCCITYFWHFFVKTSLVYCLQCSCVLLNKMRIFTGGNTVQWDFSRMDVYLRLQYWRRDKWCCACGGLNFIWTC